MQEALRVAQIPPGVEVIETVVSRAAERSAVLMSITKSMLVTLKRTG